MSNCSHNKHKYFSIYSIFCCIIGSFEIKKKLFSTLIIYFYMKIKYLRNEFNQRYFDFNSLIKTINSFLNIELKI